MTSSESNPPAGPLFDRVVTVDWSAGSRPTVGRDSIWVCGVDTAAAHDPTLPGATWTVNVPTRTQAVELLARVITERRDRVLLAVDVSLGYPAGTAAALGLTGVPWAATWALLAGEIVDEADNRNNRFEVAGRLNARIAGGGPGPFWGCPPRQRSSTLTSTKVAPDPLPTWRLAEESLRHRGLRPFSCWQLLGAGAVGSQSLVGIAALRRLVTRLAELGVEAHVWPFTTGLAAPVAAPGQVVIAEAWPSMVDLSPFEHGRVRDEAQVLALGHHLTALDRVGRLAVDLSPAVAAGSRRDVVDEEGWILGVHPARPED